MHPHEHRDLSLGTNSAGGYLVTPTKLSDDIVTAVNNLVFIRQLAQVTRLTDAKSLGNPQLTTDIQGITWGDEVTVSTADSSLVFGRRDLTPNMATNLIKVSYRELQASPRVEEVVSQRIALSYAYGEETAYMTGTGSGQPLGVFTADASGIPTSRDVTATGASHSIAADDLFNMVYNIPQQYQDKDSFRWAMHRLAVKQCVKLKDGNGQYLWNVGGYISPLTGKRANTLCGFPVMQSEYAPSTFSTNAYIAVLGDFSFYRIVETMDLEIQRLIELFAATGQIGFLSRKFLDGAPVLAAAFSRLKLA
jgi:HK97 family phage major capsid protein